jgi:hypothetical protein
MVQAPASAAHLPPTGCTSPRRNGEKGASQRPKCMPIDLPRKCRSCLGKPRPNKNTNVPPLVSGAGGAGDPEEVVRMKETHDANLYTRSGND